MSALRFATGSTAMKRRSASSSAVASPRTRVHHGDAEHAPPLQLGNELINAGSGPLGHAGLVVREFWF
jgi:hypothetical protein